MPTAVKGVIVLNNELRVSSMNPIGRNFIQANSEIVHTLDRNCLNPEWDKCLSSPIAFVAAVQNILSLLNI